VHADVAIARWGEHMDPKMEKRLSEKLGWQEAHGEGDEREPSKGRAVYARFLASIGFYTNKKPASPKRNTRKSNGSQLPPFLTSMIKDYETLGVHEKKLARQYLRNLCMTWTQCKREQDPSVYSVTFLSQPSKRRLVKEANLLVKSMNIVWGMNLKPKHRTVHETRTNV